MADIDQAREQLADLLSKIPSSGSFEAARLSKKILELSRKIEVLYSRPELAETNPAAAPPAQPAER